jgi:hypothetical protein
LCLRIALLGCLANCAYPGCGEIGAIRIAHCYIKPR